MLPEKLIELIKKMVAQGIADNSDLDPDQLQEAVLKSVISALEESDAENTEGDTEGDADGIKKKDENLNCIRCDHFNMYSGCPGYSEYTPGHNMGMSCGKHHWDFDSYETSQDEFRKMMETAETCGDYRDYRNGN